MKRTTILFGLALVMTGIAAAQDAGGIKIANLKDANLDLMNNHDPGSELENFELLPGYEVNLFATDPMLANPVHMVWDSRGRLWVACTWSYPQIKPGEVANDKIIILEDTDGDGAADKSTVFAEGLYMPTGIELAHGGCYVAQTPDVFFLKDTDGDDIADVKEVALTGFGIEDSHHSISAWRRGPGGWIYFQEGIFLHSQIETQYGIVRNFNGGVYQYNPRTGELRMFCTGTGGNPWGHVFDHWGQSFMVNNPRIMYLSAGSGASKGNSRITTLIKTEKQCGGDLVTGSHLPDEIQGQLLTCRFKSRTVVRYAFSDDGAGFSASVLEPLIKSKHPNFRPVDCKIGPDGAVYVADWYNSIINHAQHDFRDPRRDHDHGRIWRITYKDRPLAEKPKLVGASTRSLVEQLSSPDTWTRHQARKELSERDPDMVSAAVEAWVESLSPATPQYDHCLVEAMWACQNVERPSQSILQRVLSAEDGHARSAGARVIRYWHDQLSDPVGMIAAAANDPFPRTRMEAVLSAGFVPDGRALTAALQSLDHPQDPFIETALEQTISALAEYLSPDLEFAKPEHQAYAILHAGTDVASQLNELLRTGKGPPKQIELVCRQFTQNPSETGVNQIVRALSRKQQGLSPELSRALLEVVSTIGRRKHFSMESTARPLSGLLGRYPAELLPALLETLAACKVQRATKPIIALLNEQAQPTTVRIAAARSLGELGSRAAVEALNAISGDDNPAAQREIAVHGIMMADPAFAAQVAAELLAGDNAEVDSIRLVNSFLQRKGGDRALTKAVRQMKPQAAVASRLTSHFNRTGTLPESLAKHFQPRLNPQLLADLLATEIDQLSGEVAERGDPFRGEMIYRRKQLACTSCHGIAQVGAKTAPDLAAVGGASKTDYIVDAILRPSKALAEHYETTVVQTIDGNIRTGIIISQSEDEIVLRDPNKGEPMKIAVEDIEATRQGGSLMPVGLVQNLTDKQEFLDLVSFVSQLGRPGPFMTTTKPIIKFWQVIADSRPASELDLGSISRESNWTSAYSKVDGELSAADWMSDSAVSRSTFLRNTVDVQRAGMIVLKLNSMAGIRIWIADREIDNLTVPQTLDLGRQEITILIDNAARGSKGLRVELVDDPLHTARYQIGVGE